MLQRSFGLIRGLTVLLLSCISAQAFGDDLNGANTSWILTSTALVLFMTIPGLSLLRWFGALKKCFISTNAMLCYYLPCLINLVCLRL